jgi:hypothetical protein
MYVPISAAPNEEETLRCKAKAVVYDKSGRCLCKEQKNDE